MSTPRNPRPRWFCALIGHSTVEVTLITDRDRRFLCTECGASWFEKHTGERIQP